MWPVGTCAKVFPHGLVFHGANKDLVAIFSTLVQRGATFSAGTSQNHLYTLATH